MPDPVAEARFAADPPEHRITVNLDALVAIYHRPSGATHLLAAPSPELLDALVQAPADAGELLRRLADRFDIGDANPEAIAARLGELEEAGLVRRV
ncbi:HPr-rel-A system PqqD family peptide chaperone [Sphingomonas sp.]|uniref:HPr-rel-A system PqqD family peptide chaperone n=1 Tax=Sphingomonas sp. TaxID=28214 RepID=UPI003AFF6B1B